MESKCTELVVGAIFVWQLDAGALGQLKISQLGKFSWQRRRTCKLCVSWPPTFGLDHFWSLIIWKVLLMLGRVYCCPPCNYTRLGIFLSDCEIHGP